MSRQREPHSAAFGERLGEATEVSVPHLVGKVYESAPPAERSRLLEHLVRPLGVLSLAAVANGVFAKLRFLGGWPDLHVRPEDAESIGAEDVIALVEYVQQASSEVMYGLVRILSESPALSTVAGATVLIAVLASRARRHPGDSSDLML